MTRIKASEVAELRRELLEQQDYICPLCDKQIIEGQDVLDHDHETGHVRGVLHRACNHSEGRVLGWIRRTGKQNDPVKVLKNLYEYWIQDYSRNPLHHTHKSDIERQIQSLRKRMRSVKRKETKLKYQNKIKKLQLEAMNDH